MTMTNENILIKFKQIIIETISNRYELGFNTLAIHYVINYLPIY